MAGKARARSEMTGVGGTPCSAAAISCGGRCSGPWDTRDASRGRMPEEPQPTEYGNRFHYYYSRTS
jgi:hypothetical protein